MADEHLDKQNPCEDESHKKDVGAQEIDKLAADANWGVQSDSHHQTDHITEESDRQINKSAKEMAWHIEARISGVICPDKLVDQWTDLCHT